MIWVAIRLLWLCPDFLWYALPRWVRGPYSSPWDS